MPISEYLAFMLQLFSFIPFTIFDYLFFILAAIFIFEDSSFGFVSSLFHLISIAVSIFISFLFYSTLASWFMQLLNLTKGFADAISFICFFVIIFIVVTILTTVIGEKLNEFPLPKKLDSILGAACGTISFLFISSIVSALLLSFPLPPAVKNFITQSVTNKILFSKTQSFEAGARTIFGGAIKDTFNFLTVEPGSNETIPLNFKIANPVTDKESEVEMFTEINTLRNGKGLVKFALDDSLTILAEKDAKEMLVHGYFSHYGINEFSPFDRLEAARIFYTTAGENLALATNTEIAMNGLLKSAAHRKNLLSPDFRKIGIGVMDAGIYGKMFVQEFTD